MREYTVRVYDVLIIDEAESVVLAEGFVQAPLSAEERIAACRATQLARLRGSSEGRARGVL